MKTLQKLIFQISVILFFITSAYAQTEQKPILIDEFGRLNAEENFARLDFLESELSKNENSKAIIRIIGGGEDCFLCHYRQGSYTTAILKSRKKSLEKYSIEYCNENEELRIQFYLMPPKSTLPACPQTLNTSNQSVLFETIYFFSNNQITPLENAYIETTSPADGEYSFEALKVLKNILDKSPGSKIYIVVYLGTNLESGYNYEKKGYVEKEIRKLDKKSLAGRLLLNAKNEIAKNGIKPSQIETIVGGYKDGERELEFWFVPKGSEIPKPKPDYFPKKNRKTKANKFR